MMPHYETVFDHELQTQAHIAHGSQCVVPQRLPTLLHLWSVIKLIYGGYKITYQPSESLNTASPRKRRTPNDTDTTP